MRPCVISLLIACAGILESGCQAPSCIRHSQCKSGLECRDNKCQLPLTDAKAGAGGTSGASGPKLAGGTVSLSPGNGSSGSSGSGTSGSSAPANPDAGMSP